MLPHTYVAPCLNPSCHTSCLLTRYCSDTCDYITSQEQADGSTGRCEKEVLGSSNRCEEHQQCKEPSCDHEVILGGACCTAHTCKVRGCFESPSDTGFCLIHLPCAFAGCYENFAIDPQQGGFWEPSRFCTDRKSSGIHSMFEGVSAN